MNPTHQHNYLESKVLTAPSYKLHLMLLEGGLRFARAAQAACETNDREATSEALSRAMAIAEELIVGVRHGQSEIGQKLEGLYQFVFRRLAEARLFSERAAECLADAVRILELERETWHQASQKWAGRSAGNAGSLTSAAQHSRPAGLLVLPLGPAADSLGPGLSLEA